MHSKPAQILRFIALTALVAASLGVGYKFYEAYSLPRSSEGERRTVIDLGRGPKVYGTSQEVALSRISNAMAIAGIFVGLVAIGIAKRYCPEVALGILALKAKGSAKGADIFYLRKSLFTPSERSFFCVLEALEIPGVTVASKVRLADIFGVTKGLERGAWQRAQNGISSKHVDFVLLQETDGKPMLGIELDDSSHGDGERIARDSFVDSVFASAALPILHIPVRSAYNPA